MDVGVGLPTTVPGADGRDVIEFARRAEQLGFSTLAAIDRLVYDSYDSVTALAAAAGATERIKLASTILLAAYRPSAVLLAKQLASIDRMSGGRLTVGVASGGRPDDFEATGVDYHQRGRILDGLLDEMKSVWSGKHAMSGIGPTPVHGEVPLWIGGHSPAALRRAARHGIGWISPGGSISAYPDLVARAKQVFAENGRADTPKMAALTYVALGAERNRQGTAYLLDYYSYIGEKAQYLAAGVISDEGKLREMIDGYAEAGCDELLLFPCTSDPEHLDAIAKVAL